MGGEFYPYLRRFDDAYAILDEALRVTPDSETARINKAAVLQQQGRLPEAAHEIAQIREDSTDDFVIEGRVNQAMYERQFEKAISVIERKLNSLPPGQPLDSLTNLALVELGFCQKWTGQQMAAEQTFSRAIRGIKPSPDTVVGAEANGLPSTLALAYAGLGQKEAALQQAQRAVAQYEKDAVDLPKTMTVLAQIQAQLGDLDSAIAGIPHLLEVRAGITRADLRLNPFWDPLRKDPRFQKLCEERKP